MPSVHVNAASSSVTFYIKGPFRTHVMNKTTSSYNAGYTNVDDRSEWLDECLIVDVKTSYGGIVDNFTDNNYLGRFYSIQSTYREMKSGSNGYYEVTVDSWEVSTIINYLEGKGSEGDYYYEIPGECFKFKVTEENGNYYANPSKSHTWVNVTSATCQKKATQKCSVCGETREVGELVSHKYTVVSNATDEHGTIHACSMCGSTYTDNNRLKPTLTFNAQKNGGETSETSKVCGVDSNITLADATASKAGWEFVGWNTDRTAKTGLTSVVMNSNKTVFAIFKKDLTANFIDG